MRLIINTNMGGGDRSVQILGSMCGWTDKQTDGGGGWGGRVIIILFQKMVMYQEGKHLIDQSVNSSLSIVQVKA